MLLPLLYCCYIAVFTKLIALDEIDSAEKTAQYKDSTGRALPMLLLNRAEVDCLN